MTPPLNTPHSFTITNHQNPGISPNLYTEVTQDPSKKTKIMGSKNLQQIFRMICYMIKKSLISRKKLMLDLQLLLQRCKIVGKPKNIEFSREDSSAAIARAFEILNHHEKYDAGRPVMASPSPASAWSFMKRTPTVVRRIRVTDSPFPIEEEEEEEGGRVDEQAEDFIRRFYEQLKFQQRM